MKLHCKQEPAFLSVAENNEDGHHGIHGTVVGGGESSMANKGNFVVIESMEDGIWDDLVRSKIEKRSRLGAAGGMRGLLVAAVILLLQVTVVRKLYDGVSTYSSAA